MGRKLVGIDLDRTTLNDAGNISIKTRQTIQKMQQAGHVVAIITGRPVRLSMDIYQQLGLKSPMINFNGSLVKFLIKWEHAYFTADCEIAFD